MLPMYWIVQVKNKKRLYIIITILTIILLLSFSTFFQNLGRMTNKLDAYYNSYVNSGKKVNIFRILVLILPTILMATQYKELVQKNKKNEILYIYSFISMIIMIFSNKYLYFSRLYSYFGLVNILLIPELIYIIKKQIIILLIIYILYFTFGYIDIAKNIYDYRTNSGIVIKPINTLKE